MPRYYFHFRWADDAVKDTEGVELAGFDTAYHYACGLERVRNFPILSGFPNHANSASPLLIVDGGRTMARAYSQDLRDRVIDAALGGLPARRAAAQFRIGLATAIRWVRRARQTGDRTAGRQGQPQRSKLDLHRDYILGLLEATPDMTISEMLDKLAAERDVYAARATLWTFLDRCGLTFKKRPRTRPSRTARTS